MRAQDLGRSEPAQRRNVRPGDAPRLDAANTQNLAECTDDRALADAGATDELDDQPWAADDGGVTRTALSLELMQGGCQATSSSRPRATTRNVSLWRDRKNSYMGR